MSAYHGFAAWRTKVVRCTLQGREPVAPVAAEVLVQAFVGVDAEELPDTFDGQTSLSARMGWGPRRRSCRPPSQSSIRQYTVMSSVVASMLDPRTRGDGLTASVRVSQLPETRTPG
jgi:hypothetical protein